MLDIARLEARMRSRIAVFLRYPDPTFVDSAVGALAVGGYVERLYAAAFLPRAER